MSAFVDFDEVKAKIGIPEVLEKLGIANQFQPANGMLRGVCPFPTHQHNPVRPNPNQFTMRRIDGIWMWKCWGDCKVAGTVVTFLERYLQISPAHVRLWLHEHFANRLNAKPGTGRGEAVSRRHRKRRSPPGDAITGTGREQNDSTSGATSAKYKPIRFTLQLQQEHVPYLTQRGLAQETIERYGIGLCNRGMLKGYIAIPVWECPRGPYPYGYLGRWCGEDFDEDDGRPRYRWPAGFPMTRFVYGLQEARETPDDWPLIVVEGCFKVFHLAQHGFPHAVATFGSFLSDEQAALLLNTGRPVVLMYDGNEDGRAGMRKAAAKLIAGTFVRVVKLADCVEPDHLDGGQLFDRLGFAAVGLRPQEGSRTAH